MISLVMGSAVYLAMMQAGIDAPRAAFSTCLKEAAVKAKADKLPATGFGDFVKATCGTKAESLKSALIKFDVKYGIKRAQAAADAEVQIDDYFKSSSSTYNVQNKSAVASK